MTINTVPPVTFGSPGPVDASLPNPVLPNLKAEEAEAFESRTEGFLNTSVRYRIMELPVRDLSVDLAVQRAFVNKRQVADIVANPIFEAFGLPVVSERADRTLHVIDGWHRSLALNELITLNRLPEHYRHECRVFRDLTRKQEAQLFDRLNTFTDVQPIEKFRVRLEAEDPATLAVRDMLARYDWTVAMGNLEGKFAAVQTIMKAYALNPDAAERAIRILTATWGNHPSSVNGFFVMGFTLFFDRYESDVDDVRLIERLQSTGTATFFLGKAKNLKETTGDGVTVPNTVADLLVRTYNRALKSKGLPAWFNA